MKYNDETENKAEPPGQNVGADPEHANAKRRATTTSDSALDDLRDLRASVVKSEKQNRTFPDETPPGSKNEPLIINDLHKANPNGRPVLHPENANGNGHVNGHVDRNGNGHLKGNGYLHVDGNGHPRGSGHYTPNEGRNP